MKIDFFGHARNPFDDSEFARRRVVEVRQGKALFVKSPEDTILRKLLWFREGGEVSDRQWRDVLGVLRGRRGDLDYGYLSRWAEKLVLSDLLGRALDESA